MDKGFPNQEWKTGKFEVVVGEKTARVEIISLTSYICVVEFAGEEPVFITRLRDKNNIYHWVSMPQGRNDIAETVGKYVDEMLHAENNSSPSK